MAKTTTLIKRWTFVEDERSGTTLTSPARLNPSTSCLELAPSSSGYPLEPGVAVTKMFAPSSVKQWLLFEVIAKHPTIGVTVATSATFRVSDGTNQYVWNGSSWVVTSSNWNTEAEIANHISSFPTTAKQIGFVIKLVTTDRRVTPKVMELKLAWVSKVTDFLENLMVRTLVPSLRSINYIADFAFKIPIPGGRNLNVGTAVQQALTPFDLQNCDSIFNHTTDGEHESDLLQSYSTATKVATLSSAIPVGHTAFIKAVVGTSVTFYRTSADFIELDKVPAILITDAEAVNSQPLSRDDHVTNRDTGDAIVLPPPYRFDVRFNMLLVAPGTQDLLRMVESVVGFMDENQLLRSGALDEEYRLQMIDEFKTSSKTELNDVAQCSASFMIYDVNSYRKPARASKAIMRFTPRAAQSTLNINQT